MKSALGSKSPSDIYWITANSTGTPPFGMTVNSSAAGIKKITLDYSKWAISVDEATSVDVTIGAAGASTLCAPAALTIPSGVKAYTLEYDGSALQAHEVTTTIPANTPVLLNAAAGNYSFAIAGDASIGTDVRSSKTYYPDVTTTNNNLCFCLTTCLKIAMFSRMVLAVSVSIRLMLTTMPSMLSAAMLHSPMLRLTP